MLGGRSGIINVPFDIPTRKTRCVATPLNFLEGVEMVFGEVEVVFEEFDFLCAEGGVGDS